MKIILSILISAIAIQVLFTGCSTNDATTGPKGDPLSGSWSDNAFSIKKATYMIGFKKSDNEVFIFGTGFAVDPHHIATNGHIALGAPYGLDYYHSYFKEDLKFVAVKSGTPTSSPECIILNKYVVHQGFNGLFSPDYSLFYTDEVLPDPVSLEPLSILESLTEGTPIATLGYPGEIAFYMGRTYPEPVFKEGTISALHPFSSTNNSEPKYIVQHNFDLTGGTSGSPIFDQTGKVIAINNSGWTGLSLGFGIRIDLLDYCLKQSSYSSIYDISINEFSNWSPVYYSNPSIDKIAIGDSISKVDSIYGLNRESVFDSMPVKIVSYTDGFSYKVEMLFYEGRAERFIISNSPGQERLNRFRETNFGTELTIGAGHNSIDIAFGPSIFKDTINGLIIQHYPEYGVSFAFKAPDDGFCDAIILYPGKWLVPMLNKITATEIADAKQILKKSAVPRSFNDVPPFRMAKYGMNLLKSDIKYFKE